MRSHRASAYNDEPIVQASSDVPNAYLYKNVFSRSAYGTLHIDCECSMDFFFVMIHGHHMSGGTAFAKFADFIDVDLACDAA